MEKVILSTLSVEELTETLTQKIFALIKSEVKSNPIKTKEKEILTREETAKLCNIKSLTTLWNWEQDGRLIPAMRAGKKPLYLRQDVLNFLNIKEGDSLV
ncbi:DNA-binding protein [Tenacibaculum agarivorans]|uniref:DNA-binding protein n=1 Tax=Tenacibaculum agarivorans TaxID=1908389 RepID=UPI00094B949D|nr:DNA-binding protein [Tenacibaculum agarivorans]